MRVDRQVVHGKTSGLLVRSADDRSDFELRDNPDDNKRIVVMDSGKMTKLDPRD